MRRHRPPTPPLRAALGAALLLAGVAGAASPSLLAAQTIDTLAIRAHTRVLAHDSLEGRGTGTPGEARAARYIVGQLRELGVPGAGADGSYLLPIPLREVTLDTTASRIVIEGIATVGAGDTGRVGEGGGRDSVVFRANHDFIPATGALSAFRDFAGTAIFAGTAGLARAALEDAGPLDGKVVVILGTIGRAGLDLVPDWKRRGAAGVLLLIPEDDGFRRIAAAYGPTRLALDASVDNPVWQPDLPIAIAGPAVAAALLADAPITPDALDGSRPFRAIPLARRVDATIGILTREVPAANIAARIPGHDASLADEVVVYTAHYDHLGVGTPDQHGDSIYNGFSDNAAGTAMLLAIAAALRDAPPARSVLFLFFTGEERGLLGSSYYVTDPVVPLERVVAVINLDAGAPPAPPRNWRLAGGKLSTLGPRARGVVTRNGWEAELTDASPNSDHWPFLRRGVPAIFIIPGQKWEGVTRAEKEELHHRWERYHQPGDEWHPDFPFAGLQRYAEVALRIGLDVANATDYVPLTTTGTGGGAGR